MTQKCLISQSPKITRKIAEHLAKKLAQGKMLLLEGEIGSGKTVFVQGLARGLGISSKKVSSPSFAIIQEYVGKVSLCHVDLYRLSLSEIRNLGLEEYWQNGNWILAVEWADKANNFFPSSALKIEFKFLSKNSRKLFFSGELGWEKILKKLKKF